MNTTSPRAIQDQVIAKLQVSCDILRQARYFSRKRVSCACRRWMGGWNSAVSLPCPIVVQHRRRRQSAALKCGRSRPELSIWAATTRPRSAGQVFLDARVVRIDRNLFLLCIISVSDPSYLQSRRRASRRSSHLCVPCGNQCVDQRIKLAQHSSSASLLLPQRVCATAGTT